MTAIAPQALLPAEQNIAAATERGDRTELSDKPEDERRVRASFLRALLLALPVVPDGGGARACSVRLPGVRVCGARIEGALNLADCAGPGGGGLPGLALEECDISAEIDLSGARLARLSLRGSRIGEVRMRGVHLDGPFDFSAVRPESDAPNAPPAWIDAHGCTIRAEVLGDGARLRAPPKREQVPPRQPRYALDLSDSVIDGGVGLLSKVNAIGGVNVAAARIGGDFRAIDAQLAAGEGDAFCAQIVRIDGVVVLDGLTAEGRVSLLGAKIGGTLECQRACFANRTKDGRSDALVADNAEIGGAVLLRGGYAAEGRVSLLGARIGGNLECTGAHFGNRTEHGGGNALVVDNAVIRGDVLLRDGFTAEGRVSLLRAKIGGKLDCKRARFSNGTKDGSGNALVADGAKISGDVRLGGFTAMGRVSLTGARIGGNVECQRARCANNTVNGSGDALVAENAEIGGAVRLHSFWADGRVSLQAAKIGGNLECNGARFANRTKDKNGEGDALVAEGVETRGSVLLSDGFMAEGRVQLLGAKIGGTLDCGGGHFANRTEDGKGYALVAEGTEIGSGVLLRDGFTAEGRVSFYTAKMGAVECGSATDNSLPASMPTLRNHCGDAAAITLDLTSATIDRDAQLRVVSIGGISLWGCQVGGNLDCAGATFVAWPPSGQRSEAGEERALDARNLTAGGDVILCNAIVLGRLIFEHADIAGGLRWDGMRFPRSVQVAAPAVRDAKLSWEDTTWSYSGRVNAAASNPNSLSPPEGTDAGIVLTHARIGAALQAHDLAAEVPLLIDLGAASAYTLDDVEDGDASGFRTGWGGDGPDGKPVARLNLDGFVYKRIEHFPAAPPSEGGRLRQWLFRFLRWIAAILAPLGRVLAWPLAPLHKTPLGRAVARAWDRLRKWVSGGEDIASPRLNWLRRQHVTRYGAFFPQPYRYLAMVLRAQGHMQAARTVAIAEQDATPYGPWSPFRRFFFGRCFGYGLSPLRASVTLALTLVVGTTLVWAAWTQPWKDRPAAEAEPLLVLTADQEAALSAQQQLAGLQVDVGARQCGMHEIQPLFYAMDMMLPVIPLHQEDRCEVAARSGTWGWQVAWAVFSILGKIVASLALITYSGVLKPKDE